MFIYFLVFTHDWYQFLTLVRCMNKYGKITTISYNRGRIVVLPKNESLNYMLKARQIMFWTRNIP